MIDLKWIISEENKLTDRARFDLGDNYMLLIDLLKLLQSITTFSKDNEVAHNFETQIINDFHLASLNIIRRHSTIANFLIRHAIESLILFTYSMEYKKEEDYKIVRDELGIIQYEDDTLSKANKFFEAKFPEQSHYFEGYKTIINKFYSHSNIFSSQYNTATIDERLKSLVFDNYLDEFIRSYICVLNDIIITTLEIYMKLENEYKSFSFQDGFKEQFNELNQRHIKNYKDFKNQKEVQSEFPDVIKIQGKLKKKYEKYKSKNK